MTRPALALAFLLLVPATAQATDIDKYKPEIFEDPAKLEKKAGDYLELDEFEDIQKKKPKKMAVSEFTVTFVTQALDQGSGGILQLAGVGKKNFEYGEELEKRLTEELYRIFVDQMKAKGFEILPREQLVASPFYQAFVGQIDPKTKSAFYSAAHAGSGGVASKAKVRSPEGMKDLPWSGKDEEINEQNEARMIEGLGLDGVFHANVTIGLFKAKHACVEIGTKISHRLGFKTSKDKKTGEIEYGYVDWGDAGLTTGLYMEEEIQTGKDFKSGEGTEVAFDQAKFEDSVDRMWTAVVKMAAVGM
jgi:hypothetical protein